MIRTKEATNIGGMFKESIFFVSFLKTPTEI